MAKKEKITLNVPTGKPDTWKLYLVGFVLLALFTVGVYGPVFRHLAEENYFSFDALPMAYVLRLPLGKLYWFGRFLTLVFCNRIVGGLVLAGMLTLIAWFVDRPLPQKWRGAGFLVPVLLMSWTVYRGYNLYFRNEPSVVMLLVVLFLLLSAVCVFFRKKSVENVTLLKRFGLYVMLLSTLGLSLLAWTTRQNVILSCDMQNKLMDDDWEGIIDDALSARHPDRSVAAYHVIGLNAIGQVLERTFEIRYDFPEVKLDSIGNMDEGVNYVADCNLYAGLVQPAYHTTMENLVMGGPRVMYFKRMAMCSVINGERKLAERYLNIVSQMPFQSAFVEKYTHYLNDSTAMRNDPTIARILQFAPQPNLQNPMQGVFEQQYRQPTFLGYNVGVLAGSDETLSTSVAAAMYSKDLENVILRSRYLQSRRSLPLTLQQALVIASLKRPGLLEQFPEVKNNPMVESEVKSFLMDATPLTQERKEALVGVTDSVQMKEINDQFDERMADALQSRWMGSYMYYYYCGNLKQAKGKKQETGVN